MTDTDKSREAPFHRAAFINAIADEGSKEDAIEAVQTKTRPTDFIASLRALAEGDSG